MPRSVFPAEERGSGVKFSSRAVKIQKAGHPIASDSPHSDDVGGESSGNQTQSDDYQGYLDRLQNYIPAEIIAFYIFVNSLISETTDSENSEWTIDGGVAVAALLAGIFACFFYAKAASAKDENPAWLNQAVFWVIAFLIWVYAIDAKVLDVFNIALVPSLAGFLLAGFTLFSGLVIPKQPEAK